MKSIQIAISIGTVLVLVFVLNKVGLLRIKSKEEKQAKTERKVADYKITRSQALDPKFWSTQPKYKLLPENEAKKKAKSIRWDLSLVSHDISGLLGTINTLKYKAQLSQIAFYFLADYGDDMATHITKHTWKGEAATIWNAIDNIPS